MIIVITKEQQQEIRQKLRITSDPLLCDPQQSLTDEIK